MTGMEVNLSLILQLTTLASVITAIAIFIFKNGWYVKEQFLKLWDKIELVEMALNEKLKQVDEKVDKMMNNHLAHIAEDIKDIAKKQTEMDKKLYSHLENHKQ